MDTASRLLLYGLLGLPAVYVGVILLSVGPLGWFAVAFLLLAVLATKTWTGDDSAAAPVRVNCEECGSPNPPECERCEYCDASLGDQ